MGMIRGIYMAIIVGMKVRVYISITGMSIGSM
jgi:hypothetical protein